MNIMRVVVGGGGGGCSRLSELTHMCIFSICLDVCPVCNWFDQYCVYLKVGLPMAMERLPYP